MAITQVSRPRSGRGEEADMWVIDAAIGCLWIAFWLYWLASASGVKAARGRPSRAVGARVAILVLLLIAFRTGAIGRHAATGSRLLGGIGLALVVLGLALAVWARLYLGRNWGMPMTQKLDPELVTGGPYRTIRHPIYSGLILAMVGTALATSVYGLIFVALLGGYFVYSARMEERYLVTQFPEAYPRYQASTNALIPFLY